MAKPLHTVAETAAYVARCKSFGMTPEDRTRIVDQVAADPRDGDLVRGSGGIRKIRFGGSGGYLIMVAYLGDGMPAYLLSILSKGQQANFSKAQVAIMHDLTKDLKRASRRTLEET